MSWHIQGVVGVLAEALGDGLHADQDDVGVEGEAGAFDEAGAGFALDAPEQLAGLIEDDLEVGDEHHSGEYGAGAVEAGCAGGSQRVGRVALHRCGGDGLGGVMGTSHGARLEAGPLSGRAMKPVWQRSFVVGGGNPVARTPAGARSSTELLVDDIPG